MSQTTPPLHGMPVLDVPYPRRTAADPSGDEDTSRAPAMAIPSVSRTMLGVAPTADELDSPANRPTVPDAPAVRARPAARPKRTMVGVGPYALDGARDGAARDVVEADDGPEIVIAPVRDAAPEGALDDEPASFQPSFQPSAYARDPGLGPAESIRLPRRRIEAGDWLLLAVIIALVTGVFVALL